MLADWDGRTLGAVALARMRDTAAPMPPTGLLSEEEIAVFAKWVEDGMPEGACGAVETSPDAASPPAIKCTSGRFWNDDEDEGDARMTPGRACVSCHAEHAKKERDEHEDDEEEEEEAPLFTFAGTVYPTAFEPDDCFGLGSGTKVVLTGADGMTLTLTPNTAGNFMTKVPLALPYKASVVRNGKTLSMKAEQTDGDCNGCHSVPGTPTPEMPSPPGRIVAP
jgi:hypothetical protein